MRLGTLRGTARDGELVVVSADGARYVSAAAVAPTLQAALDDWDNLAPRLASLAKQLDSRRGRSSSARPSASREVRRGGWGPPPSPSEVNDGQLATQPLDAARLASPLPRAYEWIDASAYLNHVILVRKARGAEPPESLRTDPLIYQGGSGVLLGPTDEIPLGDPAWGLDFESEVCVVLGDTPQGTSAAQAAGCVKLIMLANDITLRNLVPAELAKGFGFFASKPATAFSPFAVTPDELGPAWRDGRVHLRLRSTYNDALVGDVDAGPEMFFSFFDLIAFITRTRGFTAGTILGSGTVSNADRARGISCLAERRMIEIIETGAPKTPFMQAGDTITIEMLDASGRSLCGRINQRVGLLSAPKGDGP